MSDISELVETWYPASSAVQGEDPERAMVIFHRSHGHLPLLCKAHSCILQCSAT